MLLEFDGVEFRFDGKAEVSENDDGCGPSLSPREGFLAQSTAIKRTRAECLREGFVESTKGHISLSVAPEFRHRPSRLIRQTNVYQAPHFQQLSE